MELWYPDAGGSSRRSEIQRLRAALDGYLAVAPVSVGFSGLGVSDVEVQELTADLATSVAAAGHQVLLVDACFGSPSQLPEYGNERPDLADILAFGSGHEDIRSQVKQALSGRAEVIPGLVALRAGTDVADPVDAMAGRQFRQLLDVAGDFADFTMVAAPRWGDPTSGALAQCLDHMVLVGRIRATSAADLEAARAEFNGWSASIPAVVFLKGRRSRKSRRWFRRAPGAAKSRRRGRAPVADDPTQGGAGQTPHQAVDEDALWEPEPTSRSTPESPVAVVLPAREPDQEPGEPPPPAPEPTTPTEVEATAAGLADPETTPPSLQIPATPPLTVVLPGSDRGEQPDEVPPPVPEPTTPTGVEAAAGFADPETTPPSSQIPATPPLTVVLPRSDRGEQPDEPPPPVPEPTTPTEVEAIDYPVSDTSTPSNATTTELLQSSRPEHRLDPQRGDVATETDTALEPNERVDEPPLIDEAPSLPAAVPVPHDDGPDEHDTTATLAPTTAPDVAGPLGVPPERQSAPSHARQLSAAGLATIGIAEATDGSLGEPAPAEVVEPLHASVPRKRRSRWPLIVMVGVAIAALVIAALWLPILVDGGASERSDQYQTALLDLRETLPGTQHALEAATDPTTETAALLAVPPQTRPLDASSDTALVAAAEPLPEPLPLLRGGLIDDLATSRDSLAAVGTAGLAISQRINDTVAYRTLLADILVLPELPDEANSAEAGALGVELGSVLSDSRRAAAALPNDPAFADHRAEVDEALTGFEDLSMAYLGALEQGDSALAGDLVTTMERVRPTLTVALIPSLAEMRTQVDGALLALSADITATLAALPQ